MRLLPLPLAAVALAVLSTACAAHNQFGRTLVIEQHPFRSGDSTLDFMGGVPLPTAAALPIAVFIEGDGSRCQEYGDGLWRRFLTRHTGSYILVRPRTYVNTVCESPAFARADFFHRVGELDDLIAEVRRVYPARPIFLIGHSAGAHLAILYVHAHPGTIAGVVNLGGGTVALAEVIAEVARAKAARDLLSADALATQLRDLDALIERVRARADSQDAMWGRTYRFWHQMFFSGVTDLWARPEVPVLILHGADDLESVPASIAIRAREEYRRAGRTEAEVAILEGEGHDLINARAFALVEEWIARRR